MSEGITRRSAMRGGTVTAAGAAAGFLVARNSAAARAKPGRTAANAYGPQSSGGGELAAVADVPAGGGTVVKDASIVLTRGTDGTIHAFSAVCPHQGCLVDKVANGTIDCPCHGSRFDAVTGAVVAGPAPKALPSVAVTVRGGQVYRS